MHSLIIYQALTNPVMRIVRVSDGGIMVAATGAVSRTTSWATSYTTLAKVTLVGGVPVTIPETLPPGDYDLLIYDAETPADTDVPKIVRRIAWTGHQESLTPGVPISIVSI